MAGTALRGLGIGVVLGIAAMALAQTAGGVPEARAEGAPATVLVRAAGCGGPRTGSGVVLRSGVVLTAAHVVAGASTFDVQTSDGRIASAGRALRAPGADLATGVAPPGVRGVQLALDDPRAGDAVTVAGHPGGGPLRVRTATVAGSLAGRGPHDSVTVVRLDATVLPGESGAPVFDRRGDVAGLVYAAEEGTAQALVVPASELRRALVAIDLGEPDAC